MNQPLLFDTCATLWLMANERMRKGAVMAYDETSARGEKVFVSPITAWEIGNLARKGRFKSPHTPQRWFEILMDKPNVALAELTPEVLMESAFLPGNIHGDPGDRIIAATAREFGYTVITRDRALLEYAKEGHLSALEC